MGRGGKGGRGRGGRHGQRGDRGKHAASDRRGDPYSSLVRDNDVFKRYYKELGILPEEELKQMWDSMVEDLPSSFRFTGSNTTALAVKDIFVNRYIPLIKETIHEGRNVKPPEPAEFYPDQMAWHLKTHKMVVRKNPAFAAFQKFLVAESNSGNISRQEIVSMIPPLLLGVKPGMAVLDMCAAPGSKSAQLAEMIHGDEEARVKQALAGDVSHLEGDYSDDGRATGLLIANDTDYKRAHMLVHQLKRLDLPSLIVTQHDASIYPSIELPTTQGEKKQYLKFDRVLADVPCSGDGTPRKNPSVWKKWTPRDGIGLHSLQARILIRGLQLLKAGGRLVYSTCSMNPIENEAVIAHAIQQCGGVSKVELVDCSDQLPLLKRKAGLTEWPLFDYIRNPPEGVPPYHMWTKYESFQKSQNQNPEIKFGNIIPEMFPPASSNEEERIPLERCMRVYPHQQDTGAFFIAVLEKKSEIRIQTEPKVRNGVSATSNGTQVDVNGSNSSPKKRELEDVDLTEPSKRPKIDVPESDEPPTVPKTAEILDDVIPIGETENNVDAPANDDSGGGSALEDDNEQLNVASPEENGDVVPTEVINNLKMRANQKQTEYFEYLPADNPVIMEIFEFFGISDRFPRDRFLVRNQEGQPINGIYYTSELCKNIITANKSRGMKFVNCGIKMFVGHSTKTKETCPWRLQSEGISIIGPWASKRHITCNSRDEFHDILVEMFPKANEEGLEKLGKLGQHVKDMPTGCCILTVEASEESGFKYPMVFPLWRHPGSINLMLGKDDRFAVLLRLYNEQNPQLINFNKEKEKEKQNTAATVEETKTDINPSD